MAQPVPFRKFVPADTKDDLTRKVESAPTEHADALLSAYQLLQQLHDSGTLDLIRGLVGAGDAVVNHVVDLVSAPQPVNLLRTALALGKLASAIDPDALHGAIEGKDADGKAPSLLAIGRQMASEEARIGLSVAVSLLVALGGAVKKQRAETKQ